MTTYSIISVATSSGSEVQSKITNGSAGTLLVSPGTGSPISFSSQPQINSGIMTNTSQPCFSVAKTSTGQTNATGDGTVATIVYDNSSTVGFFDQGSNVVLATGIFTVPVSGKYLFTVNVTINGVGAAHTTGLLGIVTSAGTFNLTFNPFAVSGALASTTITQSVICNLVATNTVSVTLTISGSTKTINILQGNGQTQFGGYLIC